MTDKYAVLASQQNATELDGNIEVDLIPDNVFVDMPTEFPGFDNLRDVLIDLKDSFYQRFIKDQNVIASGDSSGLGNWVVAAEFNTGVLPAGTYRFCFSNVFRFESQDTQDMIDVNWRVDGVNLGEPRYTIAGGDAARTDGLNTRFPFMFDWSLDLTGDTNRLIECRVRVRGRQNASVQVRHSCITLEKKG